MRRIINQIKDYIAELDKKYGAIGTKEREQFDEEAWNFYNHYSPLYMIAFLEHIQTEENIYKLDLMG